MTEEKISEICRALGDPNRLKIIKLLTDGEQCACKLMEIVEGKKSCCGGEIQ